MQELRIRMHLLNQILRYVCHVVVLTAMTLTASAMGQESAISPTQTNVPFAPPVRLRAPRIIRLGVSNPDVVRPLSSLAPEAIFPVEGSPDWSVMAKDSVWVSSARANHVVQLLPSTNKIALIADVQRPCSGLAFGFDSVWVPSCGTHMLIRLNSFTGKSIAEISADPANSEGGITVGAGSIWMVVKPSNLVRISPESNSIITTIALPSSSENPIFADGFVWVSSFGHDQLLKIDPNSNTVVDTIAIGPKPRFLTVGAGSIWTLNQGNGTVSRIDIKSGRLVATVQCGIPGPGGEIAFGAGSVWAAIFDFPLTQIDAATNTVVRQWAGQGGDGVRFGFGSVWLSNLHQENVWRLASEQK
jgi:streptogramin lyase